MVVNGTIHKKYDRGSLNSRLRRYGILMDNSILLYKFLMRFVSGENITLRKTPIGYKTIITHKKLWQRGLDRLSGEAGNRRKEEKGEAQAPMEGISEGGLDWERMDPRGRPGPKRAEEKIKRMSADLSATMGIIRQSERRRRRGLSRLANESRFTTIEDP